MHAFADDWLHWQYLQHAVLQSLLEWWHSGVLMKATKCIFEGIWLVESESEVAQSWPTLCDSMDCSLPGFFVRGIFQARILEWVAISFSLIKDCAKSVNQFGRYFLWLSHCFSTACWKTVCSIVLSSLLDQTSVYSVCQSISGLSVSLIFVCFARTTLS